MESVGPNPAPPAAESPGVGRAGRFVLAILLPPFVLGAGFALVPERTSFLASQAGLVAHVLLSVLATPVFLWWLVTHTRGRRLVRPPGTRGTLAFVLRWSLVLAALLAFGSGAAAAYEGRGLSASSVHLAAGFAVAAVLALHLASESRRVAARWIAGTFVAVGLVAGGLRVAVPEAPLAPEHPAFSFELVSQDLYDRSAWCGECHVHQFEEWSESLHARNMKIPHVIEQLEHDAKEFGAIEVDGDLTHIASGEKSNVCIQCHTPETFHSDDKSPVLTNARQLEEGVGCAWCHTVRGLDREKAWYVSAPQSVRRYLGQGAANPVARRVGNWLIRWMPETHRADYAEPFLASSEFCFGCHSSSRGSYPQWRESPFAQGHPDDLVADSLRRQRDTPREAYGTAVQCQDCHMADAPTGERVREAGRSVDWRAPSDRHRNHTFLGGNVGAARQLGDEPFAAREREFRKDKILLDVTEVRRHDDGVEASVRVRTRGIGHKWPSGEGAGNREPYLQLTLLDDAGAVLGATTPPKHFSVDRTPTDSPRIQITRDDGGSGVVLEDTAIPPMGERTFAIRLRTATPPPTKGRVVVEIHSSVEPGAVIQRGTAAF